MIEIGEQTFKSIAHMRNHLSHILNNATIDEPIKDTDEKVIQELFLCHPDAKEKMQNQQIQNIIVGTHPKAKARAFCIIRENGTQETFSLKKCIEKWIQKNETENNKQKNEPQNKTNTQQNETQNIIKKLQKVITTYNQLGKEIEQLKKALADASK